MIKRITNKIKSIFRGMTRKTVDSAKKEIDDANRVPVHKHGGSGFLRGMSNKSVHQRNIERFEYNRRTRNRRRAKAAKQSRKINYRHAKQH